MLSIGPDAQIGGTLELPGGLTFHHIEKEQTMRHLIHLIRLGRLAERALNDDIETVYLKRLDDRGGRSIRVDGEWPLTAQQVRTIRKTWERVG